MAKLSDLPASAQAGIVAALILAAAGGVFYYYVWPLSSDPINGIAALKQKADAKKAENDRNEVFRQQQAAYLTQIDLLQKKLETLRTIVPDEAKIDEFVTMVYDSGRSAGTWIRTFTAQAPITRDYYVEVPFAVHVDAAYYSLLRFFEGLLKSQRIATVNGLVLAGVKSGGLFNLSPDETVEGSFTLVTYYNKPAAPAPAPKK